MDGINSIPATRYPLLFFIVCAILISCEKEIEVELPSVEHNLVVEGKIELGSPPFVTLSKSSGYFEPTDLKSIENSYLHGAVVVIKTDNISDTLKELCVNAIPSFYKPMVAQFIGVSPEQLSLINYCIYTVSIDKLFTSNYLKGEKGKIYSLSIETEGKHYTASTKIPQPVPLDSSWFILDGDTGKYGFAMAHITDPDTLGNAYRWFAKRISHGFDGKEKDNNFVAPFGSAFDDKFINGRSFNFGYDRGHRPTEEGKDEPPGEIQHYFRRDDTIVIKFCSIDINTMKFLQTYEREIFSNGNPFAAPTSLPSNITGGAMGLWAGYGFAYDTIYGKK